MDQIKRITRCGLVALVALAMVLSVTVTAMAADAASLDFDKTGSVTLTLANSDGKTVSGGEISIYRVATIYLDGGNMAYALTEEFKDCTAEIDITDTTLPAALAQYVESNNISGTAASVGSDGTVTFGDLELGLYLIVQTTASGGYKAINPFVVTVPIDDGGTWDYTVNASPKVSLNDGGDDDDDNDGGDDDDDDDDDDNGGEDDDDNGGDDDDDDSGDDDDDDSGDDDDDDSGDDDDDDDSGDDDDDDNGGGNDDDNDDNGGGDDDDDDNDGGEPDIPQTGQLNWPVPLLAVCGLLLFALGWLLRWGRRENR